MSDSQVKIKNTGPIEEIEFDFPKDRGGVKLLRGTSGSGKTTVITILHALLGNKASLADLEPRDGNEKGEIEGLGRTIKVGKRNTTAGAVAVPSLGNRLDLAALVDPGVTDPVARTKVRIRTLVSAGGVKMTPAELLGGSVDEYRKFIDLDLASRCEDPVQMADVMKRALDSAALEQEKESAVQVKLSEAKAIEAGDVEELQGVGNSEEIAAAHRSAMQRTSAVEHAIKADKIAKEHNAKVDEQIEKAKAESVLVSEEEIAEKIRKSEEVAKGLEKRLENLRAQLIADRAELEKVQSLKRHEKRLLDSKLPVSENPYTDEDLEAARAEETKAYEQLINSQKIADRKRALEESDEYRQKADSLAEVAEKLRAAAKRVAEEVQKALPPGPIRIEGAELVVQHGRRKKAVPYDVLSDGERWSIAIQYAIAAVGPGGVIALKQESWQALAPELKAAIAEQCLAAKVWLVTGEVTEGELRVEDFV